MFFKWMDDNWDSFVRQAYSKRGRDSTQSEEIISQVLLVPTVNLKAYFHELMGGDYSAALANWKRPLLYVGTERGWPADKTWATIAAERGLDAIATPDTTRIPASAGLVMKDQPDSLAARIDAFATKVAAAR